MRPFGHLIPTAMPSSTYRSQLGYHGVDCGRSVPGAVPATCSLMPPVMCRYRGGSSRPTTRSSLAIPTTTSRVRLTGRWPRPGYAEPAVNQPLAKFLRAYQTSVGYTPGPVLALALLAAAAGIAAPRSRRPQLRGPCLLTGGLVVTLLATAALVEFSWRYQLPALVH